MTDWEELADGEALITDPTESLWRQASPSYLEQDGTWSFQVFRPTSLDVRKLSVSRGSKTTPKAAYQAHVDAGLSSTGTMEVTVDEVVGVGLRAVDDSETGDAVPAAHAYVDFRPFTKRETNRAAELLLRAALDRPWAYSPD